MVHQVLWVIKGLMVHQVGQVLWDHPEHRVCVEAEETAITAPHQGPLQDTSYNLSCFRHFCIGFSRFILTTIISLSVKLSH